MRAKPIVALTIPVNMYWAEDFRWGVWKGACSITRQGYDETWHFARRDPQRRSWRRVLRTTCWLGKFKDFLKSQGHHLRRASATAGQWEMGTSWNLVVRLVSRISSWKWSICTISGQVYRWRKSALSTVDQHMPIATPILSKRSTDHANFWKSEILPEGAPRGGAEWEYFATRAGLVKFKDSLKSQGRHLRRVSATAGSGKIGTFWNLIFRLVSRI